MTASSVWIKVSVLRSRVARRLFLLFVLCALVPLIVLATFSYFEVRTHLTDLSERRLHQASKSAGMTVVERISFLETDLHVIAVALLSETGGPAGPASRDFGRRIEQRFRSLALLGDDEHVISQLAGAGAGYPRLTAAQRRHLRSGQAVVTTAPDGRGAQTVYVVRILDPAAPERGMLIGAVSPDHLWGGETFLSPSIDLCVLGQAGETLYESRPGVGPPSALVRQSLEKYGPSGRFEWSHGREDFVAGYWTLFMQPTYLTSWLLIQSEQRNDVQGPLRTFAWTFSLIVLATFLLVTIASVNQIRRRTVPIEQLAEATRRLKAKDFTHRVKVESDDEFADLGASFNDMTESMAHHIDVMSTINQIGVSLSAEKDEAKLIETVLSGAQAVFNADGGALFLIRKDGRLELALGHVASLSLGRRGPALGTPEAAGEPPGWDPGAEAGLTAGVIVCPDVHADGRPEFGRILDFDRRTGYRSRSLLSVPLRNHENDVIGILQLTNAQSRTTGETVPFSDEDQRLAASLASQAAVALTKNRLIQDFKGLFEGLTELISTAIDEQSPYTGGHVRRVVVLSRMIAEAIPRSASDALRGRALSEEQLYELRIAALLHDCGKLTMPVHLTDKATKLESIVDRIRLVEARAEIARRQHRIELLEAALRQGGPSGAGSDVFARIDAAADEYDRRLEEDLADVRSCNRGSERMPEDQWERIRQIGSRYAWTTVGSVQESLLSDDELHHLAVRSGTLTAEERKIISGHVASTIKMLERLPYPRNLRNVPSYAGTHHERLNGSGYPMGLSNGDIPIQGRIIGIADVLEALTARDRPYKRALSLPEAMGVLRGLVQDGAMDGDLYDLIVSEGIHERYADEYLRPS
jgi:HD-GYP domain-containing protein (c-di-GMP phosphodiesterase class II)/HAMP domain-containing protein